MPSHLLLYFRILLRFEIFFITQFFIRIIRKDIYIQL